MRILGIDPGLASTGFGVIQCTGGNFSMLCYGVIETKSCTPQGKRLLQLHTDLKSIIDKYTPQEASMETLYFAKNVKSALAVSEAIGVITLCIEENSLPLHFYTPNQIKLSVTGVVAAKKPLVQSCTQLLLGLGEPISPHHAADALAVAITHFHKSSFLCS